MEPIAVNPIQTHLYFLANLSIDKYFNIFPKNVYFGIMNKPDFDPNLVIKEAERIIHESQRSRIKQTPSLALRLRNNLGNTIKGKNVSLYPFAIPGAITVIWETASWIATHEINSIASLSEKYHTQLPQYPLSDIALNTIFYGGLLGCAYLVFRKQTFNNTN